MPGILSPCWEEVGLINAPVGQNSSFFSSPRSSIGSKWAHSIDYVNATHYRRDVPYEQTEPNQIVVDCIASMTDDYLIDLHRYLFPNSNYYVDYTGYFNDLYALRSRLEGQIGMED